MKEPINIVQEYKTEMRLLQRKMELYRQRAIDEVVAHHEGATEETAAFDVDGEVMGHLMGTRS